MSADIREALLLQQAVRACPGGVSAYPAKDDRPAMATPHNTPGVSSTTGPTLTAALEALLRDLGEEPVGSERQELVCDRCALPYPVWFAPNEVWNPVMRDEAGHEEFGYCCPLCFAALAEAAGLVTSAWCFSPEVMPVVEQS